MVSPSVPSDLGFIGRQAELALLTARLDRAIAGAGTLVCIAGEPGIGKSRLAAELATRAHERDARAFWGRCSADAGAPVYWPWIQIIRSAVRDRDPAVLLTEMGSGAADIAQIVPQVRELLPDLPAPPPLEPEQARFRFFDSVVTFLTRLTRTQPLLLILDDLHWADTPSLRLLESLGWELPGSRLLVVGTFRDLGVDREYPLARTLAALARAQLQDRIALRGFGEDEISRCLASGIGVDPAADVVAAVQLETAGNPFFVTEMARRLASETQGGEPTSRAPGMGSSAGLTHLLDHRLGRLPPGCRHVLTIAAVLGDEFGLNELERVAELAGDPLLELLEAAEVARLITAVPGVVGRYRFAHTLIHDALYTRLPTTRRIRLHRQVAEALEAVYGVASQPRLGSLAHHFFQAAPGGDVDKAVAYARAAGERALAALAYEEAARYFQMGLQVLDFRLPADDSGRCTLLLALGDAQNWAGEADAARATFHEAAAIAGRRADGEGLARAALGYGAVAEAGVVDPVRVALLEQALTAMGDTDSLVRVRLLNGLAAALYWSEEPQRSIALSQQALDVATRLGDAIALAHALNARREALWRPEHLGERLAIGAAMRAAATTAGDPHMLLWTCRWRIADLLESGDGAAMEKEIAAHTRLADHLRYPLHLWYVARWQAMRALLEGRFAEAEELVQRTLDLGRRTQRRDAMQLYVVQWGVLRRLQGRAAELEPAMRGLVERYPDIPVWRAGLAAVYAELGRTDAARHEFERLAGGGFSDLPRDVNWLVALTSLAQTCATLADRDRAALLYERLRPYAAHTVVAGAAVACLGAVAYYLGLLATTLARWDAAQTQFDDALALHARLGGRPWIATTHCDYGAMLFARGQPGDHARALSFVTQALDAAQELGMAGLAARAGALRDRLGPAQAPGRAAVRHPGTLTARELEVAQLLARGLTNRQIAQTLVIGERTADAHVANILGKLGFNTRAQVAAWVVESGLRPQPDA